MVNTIEAIGLTVVGAVIIGGLYISYKAIKGITSVVSNIGTGKNVRNAAAALWSNRPKIIFKGTDDLALLSGMM